MSLWLISSLTNLILQHYIVPAKALWYSTITKDVVITASILSIVTVSQIGVFNSCWCNSSAMSLGNNAYFAFGPFSDEDWNSGVTLWCAVPSFAFIVAMGFILLNSDNGDNGSNLLSRSHSERQIHLTSLAEKRRILDESGKSVPAKYNNALERQNTADSNLTTYEK
jgi:hypothetical protein